MTPAFDKDVIRAFLRDHFTILTPGEQIEIRALKVGGTGGNRQEFFATPDDAASWIVHNLPPNTETYFGINPRWGRDGSKEGVSHLLYLWADLDYKHFPSPEEAEAMLDGFDLAPTTIVKSGGGLQVYWRLTCPLEAAGWGERSERLLARLYHRMGGLDAVQDRSRIFRVAGTWNNKAEYGDVRPVRRVFYDPRATYTIEDFDRILPALPSEERTSPTPQRNADADDRPSIEEMRRILSFIPPTFPYDEYLHIWMGVASVYPGPEGLALIDEWSSEAREENGQHSSPRTEPRKHYQFKREGYGLGTVIRHAKLGGYTLPPQPVPTIRQKQRAEAMRHRTGNDHSDSTLIVTTLYDVQPIPIRWLWDKRLARGKVTILGGHPGDGKSTLTAAIAAILSRGGQWPDGTAAPVGNTLFLLAEDALDDTLRPRLDRHDADTTRIMAIPAVCNPDGSERAFSIEKHLALLEEAISVRNIALLVIDPLTSFMQHSDRNGEGDVRDLLTPLSKLAERTGVAILGIMHVGKPSGNNRRAVQQLLGSTAFGAVARAVMMVAPVSQEQGEARRVLAVVKSNLALKPPSLEWSMAAEDQPITWHGTSKHDIEELLGGGPRTTKMDQAGDFIRDVLCDGPLPSHELQARCETAGISKITRRRAEETIGTETWKEHRQDGRWLVGLPGQKEEWLTRQPTR